jgi:hypothetical protein
MTRPVPRRCTAALLALSLAPALGACGSGGPAGVRTERENIHVLTLRGTPYQMGREHARLMAAELQQGVDFIENDSDFSLMILLATNMGLVDDARARSYPDVLDECRGLADGARAAGVPGWTLDRCLILAWGDVIIDYLRQQGVGCSQLVGTGAATTDGTLVHARTLDWDRIQYMIDHPTLIVRHPTGQIPYVVVGFPGCVAPYSGMNDRGLSIASNEGYAKVDVRRAPGQSHVQMVRQMLATCGSLAEAEAFLRAQEHASAEILVVSDASARDAAVFELSATHFAVRRLSAAGVLYATNHFVDPSAAPVNDPMEPTDSSLTRFARLGELLEPGGADSRYGALDAPAAIAILRDGHNPVTGVVNPPDLFEGGGSLANNGALHSMVFVPERRALYVALGEPPVPQRPFLGFSLDALFGAADAGVPDPPSYPASSP